MKILPNLWHVYASQNYYFQWCAPLYIFGGILIWALGVDVPGYHPSVMESCFSSWLTCFRLFQSHCVSAAQFPQRPLACIIQGTQCLFSAASGGFGVCHCFGVQVTSWFSSYLFSTCLSFPLFLLCPSSSAHCSHTVVSWGCFLLSPWTSVRWLFPDIDLQSLPPSWILDPGRRLTGSLSSKNPKLNGFSFFSKTASPLEFFSGNFITLYPVSYNSNLGVIFGSPFSAHSPHIIGKVLQILTSPSLYWNCSFLSDHITIVLGQVPTPWRQSPGVDLFVSHLQCHSCISSVPFHRRDASQIRTWWDYPTAYNFFLPGLQIHKYIFLIFPASLKNFQIHRGLESMVNNCIPSPNF